MMSFLSQTDPQISSAIDAETKRKEYMVNLLATDTHTIPAVQ